MPNASLLTWEKDFQLSAKSDNLAIFRKLLSRLKMPNTPKNADHLLRGTLKLINSLLKRAWLDNHPWSSFLEHQKYKPNTAPKAKFIIVIEFDATDGQGTMGRVLSDNFSFINIVDFLRIPCDMGGRIRKIIISRTDGADLDHQDILDLKQEITGMLRPIINEDHLDAWFDASEISGVLVFSIDPQLDAPALIADTDNMDYQQKVKALLDPSILLKMVSDGTRDEFERQVRQINDVINSGIFSAIWREKRKRVDTRN